MTIKEQVFYEVAKATMHKFLKQQLAGPMLNNPNLIAYLSFPNYAIFEEHEPYRTGVLSARVSPILEFRIYYDGLNKHLHESKEKELNIVRIEHAVNK